MNKQNVIVATSAQKVLNSLVDYIAKDFLETEISQMVHMSKSGINYAVRDLVDSGFLLKRRRGRQYLYAVDYKNPVVKQIKIMKTITQIEHLVNRLKESSSKIALFGSACRGEDTPESDIDLFIISRDKSRIENEIARCKVKKKIQCVVKTHLNHLEMKKKDPDFFNQVEKGITLWEESDHEL